MHAYCLMGNHFHLVVETPQGNLVAGMKWFLGIDTGRFNRGHKHFGHLFSGRYKALSERKKTDRQEVAIARRLRGETVMTAE
ncbi:MAG: hypothetical protein O2960_18590 [Verrucomicrobia bacterium]|nr:hypothetical protein [Verrucomicrobiota bacterium]